MSNGKNAFELSSVDFKTQQFPEVLGERLHKFYAQQSLEGQVDSDRRRPVTSLVKD